MSMNSQLNIKELIGYKLKKTQHILRLHMDTALRDLDLTTPQYAVLAQLELSPGVSGATLARLAFITAQTMQNIIFNLEKRKLITRKKDPTHGRILRTELTKQGSKVVAQAHKVVQKVELHMLATISEDHKILFEKILLQCFNNLN